MVRTAASMSAAVRSFILVLAISSSLPRVTLPTLTDCGVAEPLSILAAFLISARQALRNQAVDVVIVAPSDLEANFEAGRQSTIRVEYDIVSPVKANYALVLAQQLAYGVNQQIIERAAAKGVSEVTKLGGTSSIPPAVIAAPTQADPHNLAPIDPTLTSFFLSLIHISEPTRLGMI